MVGCSIIDTELYLAHARLPRVRRLTEQAMATLRDWRANCSRPYVAWSTGKDSTLCLWLALQVDPALQAVYFDAESSLPETEEMLATLPAQWGFRLRVVKTRPLIDVLVQYGLDNPHIEQRTMQATVYEPLARLRREGYDGAVVGVRADESPGRMKGVNRLGRLFYSKSSGMLTCWPLARWTSRDVWAVTVAQSLPYNRAYDKRLGLPLEERRVSYWAGETNRECGRYVWLRRYHPDLYAQLVAQLPRVGNFV